MIVTGKNNWRKSRVVAAETYALVANIITLLSQSSKEPNFADLYTVKKNKKFTTSTYGISVTTSVKVSSLSTFMLVLWSIAIYHFLKGFKF